MSLCQDWCWHPPQTASLIHLRHLQSVRAHWYAVLWHRVAVLISYTHPTWIRFIWVLGHLWSQNDVIIRGCIHKKSTLAIVRTKKTLHVFFFIRVFPFLTYKVLSQICTVREEKHPPSPCQLCSTPSWSKSTPVAKNLRWLYSAPTDLTT